MLGVAVVSEATTEVLMAQQPKKSRRGLGRGLGALIQNTSQEEPAPEEIEEAPDQQEAAPAADENRSAEAFIIADEAPKIDLSQDTEPVESRYLEGVRPASRRRRPSDLFFGDDSADDSDSETAPVNTSSSITSGTPSVERTKASRAAMPNPILERPRKKTTEVSAEETAVEGPAVEELPQEVTETEQGSLLNEIQVDAIVPNPRQPREEFDEEAMVELVASVAEVGVLQPVVIRPTDTQGKYELIMGERRWRASKRAGLDTIPAIVRDTADQDLLRDALLENIHRSELNALEEAAAYQQLMNDFGWSQEILSKRVGRSRPHISNTLRLMNLPPAVQRQVAANVLSAGHARAILGVNDETLMTQLAQRVINEGLSVRATEELASLMLRNMHNAGQLAPRPRRNTQQFDELASTLTDLLDTSVKITLGAKKGRIAIDFASVDDLNRIMAVINSEATENE